MNICGFRYRQTRGVSIRIGGETRSRIGYATFLECLGHRRCEADVLEGVTSGGPAFPVAGTVPHNGAASSRSGYRVFVLAVVGRAPGCSGSIGGVSDCPGRSSMTPVMGPVLRIRGSGAGKSDRRGIGESEVGNTSSKSFD